ncbi:unnamed protein product [Brassica rapa]|uniref:Uncharacterized protein n=1 Tax=Brassica campestris TaxID=3711 RepID=A0A8D9HR30_BRACM|nr:unnamed protein product [Brassica rapa]
MVVCVTQTPNIKLPYDWTTIEEALVLLRFVDRCLEDHATPVYPLDLDKILICQLYFDCVINLFILKRMFCFFF